MLRPPGLTYHPAIVADPAGLFDTMRAQVAWTQQMASRQTASMGLPYNYTSASYPVAPWHPAVDALRAQIAPLVGFMATNCLLNHYPTGAHRLGWHADDVQILAPGTGIAIVSLGAQRALGLRTRAVAPDGTVGPFIYQQITLAPGSLLLLAPDLQADWQHALLSDPDAGARISLSFRHITAPPDAP